MYLARVIGTMWASRKVADADGATFQLIQPLTAEGERSGEPIVACDTVGAGPGERVLYVTSYEAVIPFVTRPGGPGLGTKVPMDAAILGIVEQLHRGPEDWPAARRAVPAAAEAPAAPARPAEPANDRPARQPKD